MVRSPYERLSEARSEFPRINNRCSAGRRYRYVYRAGNEVQGNFIDNLVKLDLEHKAPSSWYEEGCYPREPVFVVTEPTDEDDGVILSVVLDAKKASSFLSFWMPQASESWPERSCHTTSRLASTEISLRRRADRSRFESSIVRHWLL
jgi:carotenoid cleavage dioxygenase-like enzyme